MGLEPDLVFWLKQISYNSGNICIFSSIYLFKINTGFKFHVVNLFPNSI